MKKKPDPRTKTNLKKNCKTMFIFVICDPQNGTCHIHAGEICKVLGAKSLTVDELEKVEESIIIVLGGDGFLLRVLHKTIGLGNKIFGMNYGTFGFLLNKRFAAEHLIEAIETSQEAIIYPLKAIGTTTTGEEFCLYAINEISMLRETIQAANVKVSVLGKSRIERLVCDGLVVSTPAGSTAYNFSVHGPIFDYKTNLISLQPISPFRPRHWRGALLQDSCNIDIEILETNKRPVSISADFVFKQSLQKVTIFMDKSKPLSLLFEQSSPLSEKIIQEQFAV